MLKKRFAIAAIATTLAVALVPTEATAGGDPGLGALIGGALGAAIGHDINGRHGALVGGVLGAMTGASIAAGPRGYYEPGYAAPPAAYYPPAPAYYGPPRAYYRPAPVYYAPRLPVYAPVVVARRHDWRHDGRHGWRDGHHDRRDGYRY